MEQKFLNSLKEAMDVETHDVKMTDKFREYEEWSSLTYLSVIAMLDEEYDFQIEESDFRKLQTVADLYNAVNSK